jgi:hypothetical protein
VKERAANLSASVRQGSFNLATERKEDFGLIATRYGLERFLYRVSVSPSSRFVCPSKHVGADGSLMCRS